MTPNQAGNVLAAHLQNYIDSQRIVVTLGGPELRRVTNGDVQKINEALETLKSASSPPLQRPNRTAPLPEPPTPQTETAPSPKPRRRPRKAP